MTRHSVGSLTKVCTFLAGTLATLFQGPAQAQCTATSNAPTATCTGDLSNGVFLENIGQTTVADLTAPITGSIVVLNGWYFQANAPDDQPGQAGPPGSLDFSDPNYGVSATAGPGLQIFVGAQGGGNGSGTATTGNPGQSAGAGGTATLTISAPSLTGSSGQQPGGIATVQSQGGIGGDGYIPPQQSDGSDDSTLTGGAGGSGGAGGAANLTVTVPSVTLTGDGTAILVQSSGGNGGPDGASQILSWGSSFGGNGGNGGDGGAAAADLGIGQFTVTGGSGAGVLIQSIGGAGSAGTSAAYLGLGSEYGSQAGNGGNGGAGGSAQVTGSATMTVQATGPFDAIRAESIGGAGGGGGNADNPTYAVAGNGGVGGAGGTASIGTSSALFTAHIAVTGDNARGIFARSVGAPGGNGGSVAGSSVVGDNGAAFGSGPGGAVNVFVEGSASTAGDESDAIIAQSVGGFSGGSGYGASAASAGAGGSVMVQLSLSSSVANALTTSGATSDAVVAQSVGGGGGNAFNLIDGLTIIGGTGLAGGAGGEVSVQIAGSAGIETGGTFSRGVYVDSVGGGGGNAGPNTGITGLGSTGGTGGAGGTAEAVVAVPVSTTGDQSDGIFVASRGGGGGSATSKSGFEVIGGQAGSGGGDGGQASLVLSGAVSTTGADADAVTLQSVGGGGGDGAATAAIGAFYAQAIGGMGGDGGNGGNVSLNPPSSVAQPQITTRGDRSRGVLAQSIGGGGGSGGDATSVVAGGITYSHTVGGQGGGGGSGGEAILNIYAPISTSGAMSDGILAQSVGGGGGVGGSSVALAIDGAFSLNHAVGGSGGSGGAGGLVSVTATGGIATTGTHASGLLAQSVGGGGGHAGSVMSGSALSGITANLSVGGSGGSAGSGDTVGVSAAGSIATGGHNSAGIAAASIGGGGGDGSTTVTASGIAGGTIGVTVGGGGGGGGDGAAVTVTNSADLTTAGDISEGIRAQSIAGGGGSSGTVVSASGGALGDISVGVGGAGGGGGSSGLVTVTNQGGVTTSGTFATAIDAKSIAGGGGNAKGSITASGLSMGSLTATVGGRGGGGGTAGNVSVTSGGALATGGDLANGIVAQSLGGGGGEGGFAAEAGVTGGEVSGNVSLTFGGGGGAGRTAGEVLVNAPQGSIQTQGFGAMGILGQSIGGNGGNGANVYTANVAFSSDGSVQTNIGRGGTGGDSGVGGAVQIGNAAAITTQSFFATGILAQSIGGSGGSGGNVYTVVGAVSPGSAVTLGSAVGGNGGTGNEAGTVNVTNSGTITTAAGGATAIHAASIGGGGGRAGNAANLNVDLTGAGAGSSLNATANVDVGGTGGAGGSGNAVTVSNSAAIQTSGIAAPGITALSIGGGGGDGGTASSFSYGLAGVCKLITGGSGYLCGSNATDAPTTKVNVSLTAEIGGKGAAAGNGGTVTVTNTANITTHGDLGHAISAQSIGGGGGTGGEGSTGIAGWTTSTAAAAITSLGKTFTTLPKYTNISVAVGGSGGASGDGGNLDISNSAVLNTSGDLSYGIHAQSVGGGGGKGGAGSDGLWGTIAVGGRGSGGGNGGAVTVTDTGAITTSGIGGIGIFAQSVGGGGGSAGNVEKGFAQSWEGLNIGVGVGYQQAAGVGGDGGAVTVTTGAITTTGDLAHGVIAQSVGGSGGIAAISGVFSGASNNFAGSAGDAGNGGAINVTLSGPVNVSGLQAHGLFAQSASGKGSGDTSGNVTIDVNANLTASGSLGRAILAQSASAGGANNGTIAISVAKGVTVATGADGAETIGILGGASNSITNNGTLTQGNGASFVIRTDGIAQTRVDNTGTLTGSIQGATVNGGVGAGIELHNRPGGLVNAGSLLDVSNLTNQGTLAVGGQGQIGSSRLTGNLTQAAGGVLSVDLNPGGSGSSGLADRLSIDGRADLGGRVSVNLLDVWQPKPGPQSALILTAGTGLTYGGLEHTQSAVAQYRFIEPSPGALHLGYDIDFANPGIIAATNDNQDAIARHVHGVYRSQALDPGIARGLIAIEDQGSYARVMNTLSAELAVNNQTVSLLSTIAFNDALLSCAERTGDYRFFDQGQCGWLRLRGQRFTQQETHDNLGFGEDSWQLAGGGQIDVGNGWHLGAALSYEGRNLNVDDSNASSDGGQFQAGVSAKRRWDATELSGSLAVGYGDFDNDRALWPGAAVSGTQKLWLFSGQVRIAHLIEWGRWAIKPRLDLGIDYLTMDAFNESGTTDFRLRIDADGQRDTYVNLQPAIDIATEIETADGLLIRPKLTLGITQFLGNTSPAVTGRFAGAPGNVASFTASTGLDQTRFDVTAAVDIFTRTDLMVRAEVFGSFSDSSESYGGGLKFGMSF